MEVSVLMGSANGKKTVAHKKEVTQYDKHMFWADYTEYNVDIIAEVNDKYFDIGVGPKQRAEEGTLSELYGYNKMLENLNCMIEKGSYFGSVMLAFCKELGKYDEAIESMKRYNERIEKRRQEDEVKAKAEKEKLEAEKKAEEERQNKMLNELRSRGLLERKLTKLQRSQLIANLDYEERFYDIDGSGMSKVVKWFDVIVKYGYTHFTKYIINYGVHGLLSKPRSEYNASNGKDSYDMPGNLAKYLVMERVENC